MAGGERDRGRGGEVILIFSVFICHTSYSQNGKMIEQTNYTIADTTIGKIEKTIPGVRKLLGVVDIYKIIYLSDGL